MIPANLCLIAWVWFGRIVFAVGGWFLLIYGVTIVPVLLVALVITTILAFTQPARPRALTRVQTGAQLVMWLGMFVFGVVSVDFGDTEGSDISALTQLFGRSQLTLDASWTAMMVSAAVVVVAWITLLVALIAGRQRKVAST